MSRKKTILWSRLTYGMAWVYTQVIKSPIGRGMTSYPMAQESDISPRPLAKWRLWLAQFFGQGHLAGGISKCLELLANTRVSLYGLAGLLYGILGLMLCGVGYLFPRLPVGVEDPVGYGWIFAIFTILAIPLLFSKRRAGHALLSGRITGLFFSEVLGIPYDGTVQRQAERWHIGKGVIPAVLLAILGALLSLWVHPLWIPMAFVALCVVGLVFKLPETGIVLSVTSVPLLFWRNEFVILTVGLIWITWLSFGAKWLLMRRRGQWGKQERVMLLLCLSVALAGVTGGYVTLQSLWQGVVYATLISVVLLLAYLLKTRRAITGGGVGLAVVFVLILPILYASIHYGNGEVSQLVSEASVTLNQGIEALSRLWQPMGICLLLGLLPLLYTRLFATKRLRVICLLLVVICLCYQGLYRLDAWGGLLLAMAMFGLFCLLYRHELAAWGLVLLPVVVSGVGLWSYIYSDLTHEAIAKYMNALDGYTNLWQGIWRLLCDYPAGIGVSETALAEVLPKYVDVATLGVDVSFLARVVISMGFAGGFMCLLVMGLFIQKGLTCMRHSGSRRDQLHILGGMISCVSIFVYGAFKATPASLPMFFSWMVLLGLCSAYMNMVMSEMRTLTERDVPDPHACDVVYRI